MLIKHLEILNGCMVMVDNSIIDCPNDLMNMDSLKRLVKVLKASVRVDVSYLIAFNQDEIADAIFVLHYGAPITDIMNIDAVDNSGFVMENLLTKDILNIVTLSKKRHFIILSFFVNERNYDKSKLTKRFEYLKDSFLNFGFFITKYFCVVDNCIITL